MANGSAGKLNIILHGLLFLELKSTPNTWLEITAPDLSSNHNLWMGVAGNLQNINNREIHWETIPGVTAGRPGDPVEGIPGDVPDTLFRFSRNTTGVGNIDLPNNQGKIFLPWPGSWDTIRRGPRPNLGTRSPDKPSAQQVHTQLERLCSKTIGVATVLTYDAALDVPQLPGWVPTLNIEIYFQPDQPENVTAVNADLAKASKSLFSSDSFDLQINEKDGSLSASTPIGKTKFRPNSGLTFNDEVSLNEKVAVIDPRELNDPLRKCVAALRSFLLERQEQKISGTRSETAEFHASLMMASPANCPMFFLGS